MGGGGGGGKQKKKKQEANQTPSISVGLWGLSWANTVLRGRCSESFLSRQSGAKLDWLPGQAPLLGRWDPIIRQTRTPPPGFHSSSVYHMALSSWAPLTDNERRQPVQLQAKHSTFYRPKHVSGKLTVSIQFCSAFKTSPSQYLFPVHPLLQLQCLPSPQNKPCLLCASLWIQRKWNVTEWCFAQKRKKNDTFCNVLFPKGIKKGESCLERTIKTWKRLWEMGK